jgi:hypothetical protein
VKKGPVRHSLDSLAARWPTPAAWDHKSSPRAVHTKGDWEGVRPSGGTLLDATLSHHGETQTHGESTKLYLNPVFVEALMGYPAGWTDFVPLEIPSYLNAVLRHLSSSGDD